MEKKDLCISVIIPMYNSGEKTVRAIKSVQNQTFQDCAYEIIVVDDGSKDNSADFVENFKNENKVSNVTLVRKKNGGPATARNAGMRIAKGEWICLLDSDDEWLSYKIETQLQILKQYPGIDFLGCNLVGKRTKVFGREVKKLYKLSPIRLLIKWHPQPSTTIFKREILTDVGYFDESEKMKYGEDGFYLIKVCAVKNLYFSPEELVIYDGGKHSFAVSGWGSNIEGMSLGERYITQYAYKTKLINWWQFQFVRVFQYLKYLRRLYISKKT